MRSFFATNVSDDVLPIPVYLGEPTPAASRDDEVLPLPTANFKQEPKRLRQQTEGAELPTDDNGLPLPTMTFTRRCGGYD